MTVLQVIDCRWLLTVDRKKEEFLVQNRQIGPLSISQNHKLDETLAVGNNAI